MSELWAWISPSVRNIPVYVEPAFTVNIVCDRPLIDILRQVHVVRGIAARRIDRIVVPSPQLESAAVRSLLLSVLASGAVNEAELSCLVPGLAFQEMIPPLKISWTPWVGLTQTVTAIDGEHGRRGQSGVNIHHIHRRRGLDLPRVVGERDGAGSRGQVLQLRRHHVRTATRIERHHHVCRNRASPSRVVGVTVPGRAASPRVGADDLEGTVLISVKRKRDRYEF